MKKNSLQAALNRVQATVEQPVPEPQAAAIEPATVPAPLAPPAVAKEKAKVPRAAKATKAERGEGGSRTGTKLIGGHFEPEVSMQLRILAAEESTTVQALLAEAIDDLLTKKGKRRIAKR